MYTYVWPDAVFKSFFVVEQLPVCSSYLAIILVNHNASLVSYVSCEKRCVTISTPLRAYYKVQMTQII